MYVPSHFEETRIDVLRALIRARPLATVVTLSSRGMEANHIPLHLVESQGPHGTLRGHVARSNPMWSDRDGRAEALAIFHGVDGYISPSWYPTKREHGKVVPTWNYVVAHAYGPLRVIDDPAWLRGELESMVSRQEASSAEPWSIGDAPVDYVERMIAAIVGIEIAVSRLIGKWKVSQNQPAVNRRAVADALSQRGGPDDSEMARLVRQALDGD